MLLKLFENLRDGDVNTQQVLKNQVKFKSNLTEIKIGSSDFKSEDQTNAKRNVISFFNLQEKIVQLVRYFSFLLSEAYGEKYGKGLKILIPEQIL